MRDFVVQYKNIEKSIHVIFDREIQQRVKDNKTVLVSLFKSVLLCGKQRIAMRSHWDDKVSWYHDEPGKNDAVNLENFISLVMFRAETDEFLQRHLQNVPRNALHTWKTIQNEMIDKIGSHICKMILAEVKKAKHSSVIANDVTDIANKEQLSVTLCYFFNGCVKEVF